MKMPANNFATSMIGNQLTSFALRVTCGASRHEAAINRQVAQGDIEE